MTPTDVQLAEWADGFIKQLKPYERPASWDLSITGYLYSNTLYYGEECTQAVADFVDKVSEIHKERSVAFGWKKYGQNCIHLIAATYGVITPCEVIQEPDLDDLNDWGEDKALEFFNEVALAEDIQTAFSKATRIRHSRVTRDFALALDSFTSELGKIKLADTSSPYALATRTLISKLIETQQALNTFFERIP